MTRKQDEEEELEPGPLGVEDFDEELDKPVEAEEGRMPSVTR